MTRKGAILLVIILLAPTVQFVGDWMKDVADDNTQRHIALDIRNDVNNTVRNASQLQLDAEQKAIAQETTIGRQASSLLENVNKSVVLGEEQISRSAKISNDLNRSLNPLKDVLVSYWVAAPFDAPELALYRARLEKGIEEFLHLGDRRSSNNNDLYVSTAGLDGNPVEIAIPSRSSLMPRRDEVPAYYLLRYSGLHISFFHSQHPAIDFIPKSPARRPVPDLSFAVGTETGEKGSQEYSLIYSLQSHRLQINAFQLPSDPRFWQSNNKIAAVPDLSNAQLAIQIDDTMVPTLPKNGVRDEADRALSALRSQMQLGNVILRIATQEFWLNRQPKMTRLVGSEPRPFAVYLTILPRSLNALQLH